MPHPTLTTPRPSYSSDTEMARLSAPANDTPKAERKSSRLRQMFKHRPSSSASSSPATLPKVRQSIDSAPLLSPSIRPGFQQIGLLPSERSSPSPKESTEMEGLDGNNAGGSPVAVTVQDKNTKGPTENAGSKSSTVVKFPPMSLNNKYSGKNHHNTILTSSLTNS